MNRSARGRAVLAASALMVAALLAGCASATASTDVTVVQVTGSGFDPAVAEVTAGSEVRWVNLTATAHTVTTGSTAPDGQPAVPDGAAAWNSGRLLGGETFTVRPDVVGEYLYWCEIHAGEQMVGVVRVVDG